MDTPKKIPIRKMLDEVAEMVTDKNTIEEFISRQEHRFNKIEKALSSLDKSVEEQYRIAGEILQNINNLAVDNAAFFKKEDFLTIDRYLTLTVAPYVIELSTLKAVDGLRPFFSLSALDARERGKLEANALPGSIYSYPADANYARYEHPELIEQRDKAISAWVNTRYQDSEDSHTSWPVTLESFIADNVHLIDDIVLAMDEMQTDKTTIYEAINRLSQAGNTVIVPRVGSTNFTGDITFQKSGKEKKIKLKDGNIYFSVGKRKYYLELAILPSFNVEEKTVMEYIHVVGLPIKIK